MTTLVVDRLHADYHGVSAVQSRALDAALAEVPDALDEVLTDAGLPAGSGAEHVCIRAVHVDVTLDADGAIAGNARRWAAQVAAELQAALAGPEVVIYRHTRHALLDLLRSVAARDRRREWAWRQLGLVPTTPTEPTRDEVAAALAARPDLLPAVVAAAPAAAQRVLDTQGWLRLARAHAAIVAPPDAAAIALVTGTFDEEPPGDASTTGPRRELTPLDARGVAALVPPRVWASCPRPSDRHALAALALAIRRPDVAADAVSVVAVAAAGPLADRVRAPEGRRPATGEQARQGEPVDDRVVAPPPSAVGGAPDANERIGKVGVGVGGVGAPEPTDPVATRWGGVCFLLHAVAGIDLVARLGDPALGDEEPSLTLAWVVGAVTGVPADDPAVEVVTGPITEHREPSVAQRRAVDELADAVAAWLADRLEPDSVSETIWRRSAVIEREPGWIEVGYALDEVDLDVRRAGLDLDPGYVPWLGSVVRFRYA